MYKKITKSIHSVVSYEQTAITYVWKNDEDVLRTSPSLTTLNAYLIENQTIICPTKSSWRGKSTFSFSFINYYYYRKYKFIY